MLHSGLRTQIHHLQTRDILFLRLVGIENLNNQQAVRLGLKKKSQQLEEERIRKARLGRAMYSKSGGISLSLTLALIRLYRTAIILAPTQNGPSSTHILDVYSATDTKKLLLKDYQNLICSYCGGIRTSVTSVVSISSGIWRTIDIMFFQLRIRYGFRVGNNEA
jgi:hypothetical protein